MNGGNYGAGQDYQGWMNKTYADAQAEIEKRKKKKAPLLAPAFGARQEQQQAEIDEMRRAAATSALGVGAAELGRDALGRSRQAAANELMRQGGRATGLAMAGQQPMGGGMAASLRQTGLDVAGQMANQEAMFGQQLAQQEQVIQQAREGAAATALEAARYPRLEFEDDFERQQKALTEIHTIKNQVMANHPEWWGGNVDENEAYQEFMSYAAMFDYDPAMKQMFLDAAQSILEGRDDYFFSG